MKNKSKMRISMRYSLGEMMIVEKKRLLETTRLLRKSILIPILLIISFYVSFSACAASLDDNDKRNVLFINSYHPGYFWSDDITKGIQVVLAQEKNVEVHIEYLDTKRYINQEYFRHMEQLIRRKYGNKNVDVIITSDDNALDFMLGMRKTFLSNIPLIFCGIDHIDPERISGYEPIYGVEEIDGTRSTLDLIVSMRPDTHTIFFISDETKTGKVMLENVRDLESSYQVTLKFDYLVNKDVEELQTILQQLPKDSAVLYLSFIRDRAGKVFSIEESMKFIANNSAAPVYCTWGFKPDTGIIGGNILSGFTQGQISAQIAIKLLHNEDTAVIPLIQQAPLTYMFDYQAMRQFGIGIDDIPGDSTVYNKPFSIYEKYKWPFFGIFIFIILQTLLISVLLINLKKRKAGDESLRVSEERFRATFEQAAVGITHISTDGRFLRINQKFCDIVGYSYEEMLRLTFKDITHPDDLDADIEQTNLLLWGEIDTYSMEKRYFRKNGDIVWVHLTVSLVRNEAGQPQWFVSVVKDITERKKAEAALRESEDKFRNLMEQSSISIQIMTPDGRINRVNRAWMKLWGFGEELLSEVTEKYNMLKDEQARALGVMPLIEKAFMGEVVVLPLIQYDAPETIKSLDMEKVGGNKRWVQIRFYPVKDAKGKLLNVVAMEEDVTEHKDSEEEIRRLQREYTHIARVSAMGELAASLAHELKQPLAAIRSNAQAAQRFLTGGKPDIDELHEILKDIIKDNRRADDVIRKLRSMMRKSELQITKLNINNIIQDTIPLIKSYEIMENISLKIELGKNISLVSGDRVQIQQVILNLILNSTEALKEIKADSRVIVLRTNQNDKRNVTVSVIDNGPGIRKEVMEHLFEAFYTTKKEGLGMGLAISRSIIEGHGGHLWAENNADHGATFYFTIPISRGESA